MIIHGLVNKLKLSVGNQCLYEYCQNVISVLITNVNYCEWCTVAGHQHACM